MDIRTAASAMIKARHQKNSIRVISFQVEINGPE